jgi:ATPase subunit of ABC transporter with duplicated ATPase domains
VSHLHVAHVHFSYSDSVPLLLDLELRLELGWAGVVGANGAGKTTFLRLLSGDLLPDQGHVHLPGGASALYCPQEVEERTPEVEQLAEATDRVSQRLLGQLSLDPVALERWPTLSPGERKRWQIGAALAAEPLLLLLDEPTNHLDSEARDLLCDALASFRGIGLLVSHDRDLLNRLPAQTLRLHDQTLLVYRGAYDQARSTWEREERERRDEWSRLKREEDKLGRRLRDRQQKKAQSMAELRTSKHIYGRSPKDKEARNKFKGTRRRSRDVSMGKDVRKTHGRLDRVSEELSAYRFKKSVGRSLFVDYEPASSRELASVQLDELRAGPKLLLRDVSLSIGRSTRARVAGPNGSGKTTLLRALIEASRVPAGRLLYLPQELGVEAGGALLDDLRDRDPESRAHVLNLVAALGVAPEPLLASRRPSPGEARKLALADGLARKVWGLVLDEPTNHLDLPSLENLEEMLEAYPGALVVVTHDEYFARRCTETTWLLRDGSVHVG